MEIELDEWRLPGLQSAVSQFHQPIQEAIAKRDEAQMELGKLQGLYHNENENLKEVKNRLGERRRELSRLIYEATPHTAGLRQPMQMGR